MTAPKKPTPKRPPAAKQPQDHKPKIVAPKVSQTDTGWTVDHRGVTITVDRDALDSFEFLDDIAAVESGKAQRLPGLLRRLVGQDQYESVMDALRDDAGRVSLEAGGGYVREILEALNPNS